MGFLEDISNSLVKSITRTVRRLAAFIFLVFAAGVGIGLHASSGTQETQLVALGGPIALAALAYVSTAFAVAVFVLLALFLLLI